MLVELQSKGCVEECSDGEASKDGIKCFECEVLYGNQCV